MVLHWKTITRECDDYARVERLNEEAFPENERVKTEGLVAWAQKGTVYFWAFYDDEVFIGFTYLMVNISLIYMGFLRLFLNCVAKDTVVAF